MEQQAFIYQTNGEIIPVLPKNKSFFTLLELQQIVGGYIQCVYLNDGRTIVMNEEGKINNLKFNEQATKLYSNPNDFIVGDVLITPNQFMN